MEEKLLKRSELAEITSTSVNFWAKDAMKIKPLIPFIKISSKFVRYRLSDVNRFMSETNSVK